MISWAARKQLTYFFVLILIALAIGFYVFIKVTSPTCFDGKQNQNEDGVDCGGSCSEKCLGIIKDLVVVWSRPISVEDGVYDAVALVDNPNIFLGVYSVNYTFRVYDENNVLIAISPGQTFIAPGERFALFASKIDVGHTVPARAFLEFDKNINWQKIETGNAKILVTNKEFTNGEYPHMNIVIGNKSLSPAKNISAVAVLYDRDKNIIGASSTSLDSILGENSISVVFTWPKPFKEEPDSTEVFLRTRI